MSSSFAVFEKSLLALNERVGAALADALHVDASPVANARAAAFGLLLGDCNYLLQWIWMGRPQLDAHQGEWIAALESWLDRIQGEEPSEVSVPGRVRLWTALLASEGYADKLREILEPCPRSLALLRDADALNGTSHAPALAQFLQQFAQWATWQNAADWETATRRLDELNVRLRDLFESGRSSKPAGMSDLKAVAVSGDAPEMPEQGDEIHAVLAELNALVGLTNVKAEVRSLVNLLQLNRLRQTRGLPALDLTRHMVFYGGPGTGKTTVARLIARIFKALGVLKKGHLVETDRSGLVAAYVGQTALKVKRVVNQADQGVLFIDEAYALARGENDFGSEAIETLLKLMEDRRDSLVVIVAGYTDRMEQFIRSNPGLKSRFTRYFNFEDYDAAQLCDILCRLAQSHGMQLSEGALLCLQTLMQDVNHRSAIESGNARFVRNCFEKATMAQANRLSQRLNDIALTDAELLTLEAPDLQWALQESLNELGES